MSESILHAYLNEQHIKVADETSVENLKKAVAHVKKNLLKNKTNIIPFTLVALDPKVKDTDPVVQQVEKTIVQKWRAFKNSVTATKDKSITYVRAVILESLSQLTKGDAVTTALVWLTARDVIGHYQLGLEESVVKEFLKKFADRTEEYGQNALATRHRIQTNDFKVGEISISSVKVAQIDEETLKQHLLNAMVHTAWNRNAGGGANPHSQGQNNWQWPKFMAEHSAKGITEVVNSALSQQTKSLSSISTSIQLGLDTYFTQLQPFFEDLNTLLASSITANNKRTELLWWKQSLYSRSLNASYRSLDPFNAAVCIAVDLAEQVEAIYPESVDYLLRETLKDVHGKQAEEERLLSDWLKDSSSLLETIKSALTEHAEIGDERKSLLRAWANAFQSGETTDFFTETGIDKNAKLTLSDLAVWLFHGLQAKKLATTK